MSETKEPAGKRPRWRAWTRELLGMGVVLSLALTARGTLADHYHVPTGSMRPTVEVGDRIFVNKAAYGLRVPLSERWLTQFDGPAAGDVVVLHSPEDGTVLLKRIVAAPGDEVAIREGRLWRNGSFAPFELDDGGEPLERLGDAVHPLRLDDGGGPDFGPVRVPPESYLVVGDNRGNSLDGRTFGWVERKAILGKGVAVFARNGRPTWKDL